MSSEHPVTQRALKVDDALQYLDLVKNEFPDRRIYDEFLKVMKDFRSGTLATPGVISKVSTLFKGKPNLIVGFRKFLPVGYTIELSKEDQELWERQQKMGAAKPAPAKPGAPAGRPGAPPVNRPGQAARTGPGSTASLELPHAISYVTKIKKRFADDPNTYKAFLECLHGYQKQTKTINDVLERVTTLFANHPDLLRDFTYFLPDSVQEKARERIARATAEYEKRFGIRPPNMEMPRPGEPGYLPHGQSHPGPVAPSAPVQGGPAPAAPMPGVPQMRPMGPQGVYPPMGVAMGPPRGPAGAAPAYGVGGVGMAGMARPGMRPPDSQAQYAHAYDQQQQMEAYRRQQEDAQLSHREREREKERERMVDRARDRAQLGMGPGKSARVQAVLRRRRAAALDMEVLLTPTERTFFDRIRSALGPDAWVEFLKILELFSLDVLTKAELFMLVKDLFHSLGVQNVAGYGALAGQAEAEGQSTTKLLDEFKGILTNRATLEVTPQDLWYSMPATEVDLSAQPRCTPSYRQLPAGWPKLSCTMRSKEEARILNDLWVSVPTGSEDLSFKIMRKNTFEDQLFLCEDARHEVDMVLENNAATIRVLEPMLAEIEALKSVQPATSDWQFRLDSRSLGVMHLRAISRVYAEYGGEVLELLRKNPAGAIPIILARLRQKDQEWRETRAKLNVGWKEIMEKNYYKSLDHRSFYFKLADKRATTAKPLLLDIKSKADMLAQLFTQWKAAEAEATAEKARANATGAAAAAAAKADVEDKKDDKMDVDEAKGGAKADGKDKKEDKSVRAPATSLAAAQFTEGQGLPRTLRAKMRASEPVLHFLYRDTAAHQDAYKLLQYAVEKTLPHNDKPVIAHLWRTFLGPFFRFPSEWTLPASLAAYPHGYGFSDSRTTTGQGLPPSAVLQVGDAVTTPFGDGIIADVRLGGLSEADAQEQASKRASGAMDVDMAGAGSSSGSAPGPLMYEVWLLPWGRAFMNPQSVKHASTNAGAAGAGAKGRGTANDGGVLSGILSGGAQPYVTAGAGKVPISDFEKMRAGRVKPTQTAAGAGASSSGKPDAPEASAGCYDVSGPGGAVINGVHYLVAPPPPAGSVFYATSSAYLFFRLHQYICDRLTTARLLCAKGRARDSRVVRNPLDRRVAETAASGAASSGVPGRETAVLGTVAAAVARAAGQQSAREAAAHTGQSRASVAASHGDLTDVAAMAVRDDTPASTPIVGAGAGASSSAGASGSTSAEDAQATEETYQAFLTALYGAIDGTMESGKYEDECRDLMGTSAYLLFTLDKLCTSAAKQLQVIAHEAASTKLINYWMYAQAKIAFGVHKSATPADAEKATGEALAAYRQSVGGVLASIGSHRAESECFVVQYALTPSAEEGLGLPTEDVLSGIPVPTTNTAGGPGSKLGPNGTVGQTDVSKAEAWAAPAHRTASLTLRYVGKPLVDRGGAGASSQGVSSGGGRAVRGFEYAAALPAWLSRLLGTHPKRIILGDETPQIEEEDAEDESKINEDMPPPPPKPSTAMGAMDEDL